jgi:hypothetical protein
MPFTGAQNMFVRGDIVGVNFVQQLGVLWEDRFGQLFSWSGEIRPISRLLL